MTDRDQLTRIVDKARLLRRSKTATPNEVWLSDLIEALAIQLRDHTHPHVTELPYYRREESA